MSSSPVKNADAAAAEEPMLPPASASPLARVSGVKRPAPSLLPPFEPLSSSPGLPRPLKRQALAPSAFSRYPTPIPTSSTGILSSSPPRVQSSRPGLQRTQSTVSERAPLSAVPSVELNENGEMLLMGRSTNSSHYQLSANRLISRVHVKARYIPASNPLEPNKIEIICNGWNGIKLHCQGRTWELSKGDTFTSETENTEIMLDVQDARVLVHWPKRDRHESLAALSDSSWDESPRHRRNSSGSDFLQSSPLRRQTRLRSPESPTPASRSSGSLNAVLMTNDEDEPVQIYEDASGDEQELPQALPNVDVSFAETDITNNFSSDLSDPEDVEDPNEENDPIVHSFGPFGADLSSRMAAIGAESPEPPSRALSGDTTAQPSAEPEDLSSRVDVPAISNHVVNQLAYSRLSSTPLSTIMNNLPAEEKKDLTKPELRTVIESTPCIGVITRSGKDAAGKPLESEYYYVPEHDTDDSRRIAVTDGLRKPSLRACRKQHKVLTRPTPHMEMQDIDRLPAILLEETEDAIRPGIDDSQDFFSIR
ncbi:proteasome-interacting protein cic1 [Hypoxylon texense]